MAAQAQRDPAMGCNHVCHVIDGAWLREASRQTRQSRAPGVDQVTATPSAEHLEATLQDLPGRWRAHRYGAPPVARVGRDKAEGQTRPRGTPGVEAQRVQRAVVRR